VRERKRKGEREREREGERRKGQPGGEQFKLFGS
jgi:hypothetical protein